MSKCATWTCAKRLLASLPEKIAKLYHLFQPSGLATVRADVAHRDGVWAKMPSGEPSTDSAFAGSDGHQLCEVSLSARQGRPAPSI